ncbi:DUF7692 domain-containing protein [Halomicrobium katesii]|uniref:DUF7692 domain-containing protein n=1 Tax=Halomicrobium katesii TaxID=437163 RepID=UPI0003647DD9|nr:hypothetical protein [Halomicrobium katesii]
MRIRGDGTHAHRTETIEQAAERWDCNKTTALVQSAGFSRRIDERIREVLARDDLTVRQRREAAETLRVPGSYEIDIETTTTVDPQRFHVYGNSDDC